MLLLAALLTATSMSCAQELVVNGDFDSDTSGWNAAGAPETTWAPFDFAGASSGSVLITNDLAAPGAATVSLTQCVVLARAGRYVVTASGYLPAGQAAGNLYLNSVLHIPTTTCQSFGSGFGFLFPATIGSWTQVTTGTAIDDIDAAAGASLEVRIGIQKTPAGGSLQGYVDGVSVIYDTVFVAGFEPPSGRD